MDRISELSDEVLVSILSLLSFKEAVRTSVLSRRWRKVWAYHPDLIFDSVETYHYSYVQEREAILDTSRPRFLDQVNGIIDSYQGSSIGEFKVKFDLDERCQGHVDRWVNFALERRVTKLELDFSDIGGFNQERPYSLGLSCLRRLASFPFHDSLRTLQLKYVNTTGRILEHFISNCKFLERLCVVGSNSLADLNVVGASISFKYLEITHCFSLKSVKLAARELASFKYYGQPIHLDFVDAPKCVKLFLGGKHSMYFVCNIRQTSGLVSQLEKLTLHLPKIEETMASIQFPVFEQLKELELITPKLKDSSRLFVTSLIKASPLLYRLAVQLDGNKRHYQRKLHKLPRCTHKCLKVLEWVGFAGNVVEREIAMYLIESAIMLDRITIDTRDPILVGSRWEYVRGKHLHKARDHAECLRTIYALGDKLLVF